MVKQQLCHDHRRKLCTIDAPNKMSAQERLDARKWWRGLLKERSRTGSELGKGKWGE